MGEVEATLFNSVSSVGQKHSIPFQPLAINQVLRHTAFGMVDGS